MKKQTIVTLALAILASSLTHAKVVYVNKNASGPTHDGTSWATAFLTVQAGLDATDFEDEVWVAASTPAAPAYMESIRITQPGIALYGGFAGTETHRDQRDWTAHPAVINGNKNDVVSTDFDMSLDGFVIRNGGTGVVLGFVGGRSTVRNNVIEDNGAGISSNGIYVSAHNNIIRNNAGFAVSLALASATITENQIYQNGGGITGHPFIQLSLIRNRICGNGSGISLSSASTGFIENNAICDNSGYGIDIFNSTARIVNNTLAGNAGQGISVGADGDLELYNNVVAYNGGFGVFADTGGGVSKCYCNNLSVNASGNFSGWILPQGQGNLDQEPGFLNNPDSDFHLSASSICIGAGDNTVLTDGETDLDGHPRLQGQRVDMGAFEFDSFTLPEAFRALRVSAGLAAAASEDIDRLNVVDTEYSTRRIDTLDGVRIVRKVGGLESNP